MTPGVGLSATLWLRSSQLALAREVVRHAGLAVRRAGGPDPGRAPQIAAEWGAAPIDDLRAALATASGEVVLLMDSTGLGGAGVPWAGDEQMLRAARQRGAKVISLEPVPASLLELSTGVSQALRAPLVMGSEPDEADPEPGARTVPDLVWLAPLSRLCDPVRDLPEMIEQFGAVRSLSLECSGSPDSGSLGMRLWDAMDLAGRIMGEPETVHASYSGAASGRALHVLPGESLRDLHGDLTASLRFADGRGAAIFVTDQADTLALRATLTGPTGVIRVTDRDLSWRTTSGEERVASGAPRDPRGSGQIIAEQIQRLLDTSGAALGGVDVPRTLAMSQAALLSSRTGEPERPDLVRRMAGG